LTALRDPHTADELQARADQLGTTRQAGRFRAKASLDEGSSRDGTVARAVARAKEGDREAVRFLYIRYADNVYGYVRSIVRDEFEAEDVTQHVFAKLITVIGNYEQRSVPFAAWMLRLAHNAAIDHLRKRRPLPAAEVYGAHERMPEGNEERSRDLRDALAALPDEQRDVLVLRHVMGLTPPEIADRLGKTEPSIHGLHHRGRIALRLALTERGCEPTVRRSA
jgi:RNA polymerase sigma-70 factor (ECF subfamily)